MKNMNVYIYEKINIDIVFLAKGVDKVWIVTVYDIRTFTQMILILVEVLFSMSLHKQYRIQMYSNCIFLPDKPCEL